MCSPGAQPSLQTPSSPKIPPAPQNPSDPPSSPAQSPRQVRQRLGRAQHGRAHSRGWGCSACTVWARFDAKTCWGRTTLRPARCLSSPPTRVYGAHGVGERRGALGVPIPTHPRAAAERGFAARTGAELLPRPWVLPKLWEGKGEAGQEIETSGWLTLWCLPGAGESRRAAGHHPRRASPCRDPGGHHPAETLRASLPGHPAPSSCSGLG